MWSCIHNFRSDLFCRYLPRDFRIFTNFYFPENLLVATVNRFKVLKSFISLKFTVYIRHHRLWSEKALDVQGFEWKSNCTEMAKYTCDFKHKLYCNIQPNLPKQFILHSTKPYSEPFPMFNYLLGGSYFHIKAPSQMFEKVLNTLLPSKP